MLPFKGTQASKSAKGNDRSGFVPAKNSIDHKERLIHRGVKSVEGVAERARDPGLMAVGTQGMSPAIVTISSVL
jgi:hypothetical protein